MTAPTSRVTPPAEPAPLRRWPLIWLAAAVFAASAGYGALMPLLPRWLESLLPGANATDVARHVGLLSGAYAAGVLVGAPLWGIVADRVGRGRILKVGLVGHVASLLLLLTPGLAGLWGIYSMRTAAGFFVAAIVPIVPALVAAHTPVGQRARRFAWLSGMSLVGFLFGPGLITLADLLGQWAGQASAEPAMPTRLVIVLSAVLSAITMLGVAATLPVQPPTETATTAAVRMPLRAVSVVPLWWLSAAVMFVLSGFELGIVLQGQQHADLSPQDIALMFVLCSVVMLLVNGLLFFTSLLDKIEARVLASAGLLLATAGLAVLGQHRFEPWMYAGIGMTAAGTGLVLPVVAFLAAGAPRHSLGATMGGVAAAAGLGQTLGSSAGGWLFGALGQQTFNWMIAPLALTLGLLVARPGWWSATAGVRETT
ncbi:MFS transporter [Piscinibacter sp.]|uniref:MFS transporter n=1 Tax=Piscinibacter sp. TaxID=1903157 RepID=UPI002C3325A2|nr:MFS transporter [Albitalea sp.]HUG24500.1 MFS transporter [Albitalea sp.]